MKNDLRTNQKKLQLLIQKLFLVEGSFFSSVPFFFSRPVSRFFSLAQALDDFQTISFPNACKILSPVEAIHKFFFEDNEGIWNIRGQARYEPIDSLLANELLDLHFGFSLVTPLGFTKTILSDHPKELPVVQRIQSKILSDDPAVRVTRKTAHLYRINGQCSSIPKRRYENNCCTTKQEMLELNPYLAEHDFCPTNEPIKPILASNANLFARDASGAYHTYHLILTTRLTHKPDLDVIAQSAATISKKEASLKVTREKICEMAPKNIEIGIAHTTTTDFIASRLKQAQNVAQLSTNTYLRQSSIFQHKLGAIADFRHRYSRPLPNASQVYVTTRWVYLKVKENSWTLDLSVPIPFVQSYRIYDPNFIWKHSPGYSYKQVLPPMHKIINDFNSSFDHTDMSEANEHGKANRALLEKITEKMHFETANEQQIVLDSEEQAERFRNEEYDRRGRLTGSLHAFINARGSHKTMQRRAPPPPNCLNDIEVSLRPSVSTIAKFHEKNVGHSTR